MTKLMGPELPNTAVMRSIDGSLPLGAKVVDDVIPPMPILSVRCAGDYTFEVKVSCENWHTSTKVAKIDYRGTATEVTLGQWVQIIVPEEHQEQSGNVQAWIEDGGNISATAIAVVPVCLEVPAPVVDYSDGHSFATITAEACELQTATSVLRLTYEDGEVEDIAELTAKVGWCKGHNVVKAETVWAVDGYENVSDGVAVSLTGACIGMDLANLENGGGDVVDITCYELEQKAVEGSLTVGQRYRVIDYMPLHSLSIGYPIPIVPTVRPMIVTADSGSTLSSVAHLDFSDLEKEEYVTDALEALKGAKVSIATMFGYWMENSKVSHYDMWREEMGYEGQVPDFSKYNYLRGQAVHYHYDSVEDADVYADGILWVRREIATGAVEYYDDSVWKPAASLEDLVNNDFTATLNEETRDDYRMASYAAWCPIEVKAFETIGILGYPIAIKADYDVVDIQHIAVNVGGSAMRFDELRDMGIDVFNENLPTVPIAVYCARMTNFLPVMFDVSFFHDPYCNTYRRISSSDLVVAKSVVRRAKLQEGFSTMSLQWDRAHAFTPPYVNILAGNVKISGGDCCCQAAIDGTHVEMSDVYGSTVITCSEDVQGPVVIRDVRGSDLYVNRSALVDAVYGIRLCVNNGMAERVRGGSEETIYATELYYPAKGWIVTSELQDCDLPQTYQMTTDGYLDGKGWHDFFGVIPVKTSAHMRVDGEHWTKDGETYDYGHIDQGALNIELAAHTIINATGMGAAVAGGMVAMDVGCMLDGDGNPTVCKPSIGTIVQITNASDLTGGFEFNYLSQPVRNDTNPITADEILIVGEPLANFPSIGTFKVFYDGVLMGTVAVLM